MKILTILLSTILVFSLSSCGDQQSGSSGEETNFDNLHGQSGVVDEESEINILQIAIGSPEHTTLVAGVQAAQLENVLANPGPLTVFAPTNAAFDKLPEGTLEELLKPENKNKLARIITSHAAPGTFTLELLKDGSKLYMATGQYIDVEVKNGDTYVNGTKILGSIDASNGIVYVIDDVFLFAAE